jgi:hypothetical protein
MYSETWMPSAPYPYVTNEASYPHYGQLGAGADSGIPAWPPANMPELSSAYLPGPYYQMPADYAKLQAASEGMNPYQQHMYDLSCPQLAGPLPSSLLNSQISSSSPPTTDCMPSGPHLSLNHNSKLALPAQRPMLSARPGTADSNAGSDMSILSAQEHAEAEMQLPTTTADFSDIHGSLGRIPALHMPNAPMAYCAPLQHYRPYPQYRHVQPGLMPYHAYQYANPASQPGLSPEDDEQCASDTSLPELPSSLPPQPTLTSFPSPTNVDVAQHLGDDIADHFVRVERKITCPTYCKRLHVTQYMAENLLPTDQTAKDKAKGPLCYNYELLFKHKIWLIDEDLVSWPVEYEGVVCCAQRHYRLTSGWRNFVRAKNIKVGTPHQAASTGAMKCILTRCGLPAGDTVVMERRGRNRNNVYVRIVEGNGMPVKSPKAPRLKAALNRSSASTSDDTSDCMLSAPQL